MTAADGMGRVVVTRPVAGLAQMQVCVAGEVPDAEILAAVNELNPSGTEAGWALVVRAPGPLGPVPCATFPGRTHLVVEC